MAHLIIAIEYDMTSDEAKIRTNARREKVAELLDEYLQAVVGAGNAITPAQDHDVYRINLTLDLSNDTWLVKHNCGNKGLREGIVMATARFLRDTPTKVTWSEL